MAVSDSCDVVSSVNGINEVTAMGSLWWRWPVGQLATGLSLLINFSVAVPLSWLLFSYCQATPQCNAELAATGMDGPGYERSGSSLEMYVSAGRGGIRSAGPIGKPNPAGSRRFQKRALKDDVPTRIWLDQDPLTHVRTLSASNGGGAFLGWRSRQDGARSWVSASGEAAVLVLVPTCRQNHRRHSAISRLSAGSLRGDQH